MPKIKLFIDIESNFEEMERRINDWLASNAGTVINVFGNIAPQTVAPETQVARLPSRRFASSDIFVAVLYEPTD